MYYYVLMCVATLKVLVHLNRPFTNTKQFRVCCKTMLNKLIDIGE